MPKGIYYEKKTLDDFFHGGTTIYIALFLTPPTYSSDAGTEVSGSAYARQSIVANTTNFSSAVKVGASPASTNNLTVVSFPTPTSSWGSIHGAGAYDALTVGNLLYWTGFATFYIDTGFVVQFAAGGLTFTEL